MLRNVTESETNTPSEVNKVLNMLINEFNTLEKLVLEPKKTRKKKKKEKGTK